MTDFIQNITILRKAVSRTYWGQMETDYINLVNEHNSHETAFSLTHGKYVNG